MIRIKGQISWVRVSRSGRKKGVLAKDFISVVSGVLVVLTVVLWSLSSYTNWILHRKYDPEKDVLLKAWLPPWKHFYNLFPYVLSDNSAAIVNVLFASEPLESSALQTVRISVEANGLERLNSEILQYGMGFLEKKPLIKGAYYLPNGQLLPIRVGFRGVMPQHHLVWKPSLRLKFNRNMLLDGFRNHLLIAPEDGVGFRNWLSSELSRQWGFLDTGDHFVRLFINNRYMGVYNRMWRLDESLFIHSGRLPGSIFKLEHIDKREFTRVWSSWHYLEGWKKISKDSKEAGKKLLRIIDIAFDEMMVNESFTRRELAQRLEKLNEYIDRESFAKYLALLCHSGESHVDNKHNNVFWFDSVTGKMNPILEDINGYDFPSQKKGQIHRRITKNQGAFIQAWMQDPNNFALYIKRLIELIDTFGSAEAIDSVVRKVWRKVRPSALSDLYVSRAGNPKDLVPVTSLDKNVASVIRFVRGRNQWLKEQLKRAKLSVVRQQNGRFEVYTESFVPIRVTRKDGLTFRLLGNSQTVLELKMRVSKNTIIRRELREYTKSPEFYAFYEFPGKPEEYSFVHPITQKEVPFSHPPENLNTLRTVSGLNALEASNPEMKPVILGPGEVFFDKTIEYGRGQSVTIKAGTQIKFASDASLIIRGPLQIQGTRDNPVSVRPVNQKKPFGVIALLGKETQGSRISYLDMEGGSVHRRYNLKFTGMFSVHDCPDIEIHASRFGKNFVGDDAVHFMRSSVKIAHSVFENALFDAVDWDKVDGEVSDSLFLNSGNDGLDLSMGKAKIISSRFENCGDKCISAGEGVSTTIRDSSFHNCNIGVAVKDRSHAKLLDILFSGCQVAYNSFRKKWRWEKGGEGVIGNTRFANSINADIVGDKYSKVSFPDGKPENLITKGKIQIISLSVQN